MSAVESIIWSYSSLFLGLAIAWWLARILTGWSGYVARRFGIVSPVTGRSSHSIPTPRLGGIGLVSGFAAGAALFLGGLMILSQKTALVGYNPDLLFWVGLGFGLMVIVGLLDDLFDLHPLLKLLLMTLAVLPPLLGGGLVFDIKTTTLPVTAAHACAVVLTLFWILFFTNAFNFMDGMDGFAASFARMAGLFIFAVPFINGIISGALLEVRGEVYLLPVLAVACTGFLHYNQSPARIFMGDGGSLGLGYLLAVFALMGCNRVFGLPLTLTTSLTILMPFLFDVILTLIRRAWRGCNLLQAHREHLYQRLMATGLSHDEVLKINKIRFILCGLAGVAGGLMHGWLWRWGGFGVALVVMIEYWMKVLQAEANPVKKAR